MRRVRRHVRELLGMLCIVSTVFTANPRKLEHGFRMISARIPIILPSGHEAYNVPTPTLWLLFLTEASCNRVSRPS